LQNRSYSRIYTLEAATFSAESKLENISVLIVVWICYSDLIHMQRQH